ncbi:stage II sporulation protein D [Cerasibacillus terrae]|nr:stage II sporulation protein D [Cerasibacillus terrae]
MKKSWNTKHNKNWKIKQKILQKKNLQQNKQKTIMKTQNQRHPFGKPFLFIFTCLLLMMLVLPTLIVVPSASKKEVVDSVEKAQPENKEPTSMNDEGEAVTVSVMRNQTDKIEDIPLETYVSRVVANEMPAEFELEALKAQSLAARTYIVNQMLHQGKTKGPDVTDTTADQVYSDDTELRERWGKNYRSKMEKVQEAVQATKGKILTYNQAPIFPAYFSTSNGYTENSEDYWDNEHPYLRSVKSPWDKESPKFLDQQTLSLQEVGKQLGVSLASSTQIPLEITRTNSNRVKALTIGGETFSGRKVREQLNLRSNDFTVTQKGDYLIFKTKGFGHGVGMSQYGANGMAKEGKTYEDIVKHYYQDVDISSLEETAPTLVTKK